MFFKNYSHIFCNNVFILAAHITLLPPILLQSHEYTFSVALSNTGVSNMIVTLGILLSQNSKSVPFLFCVIFNIFITKVLQKLLEKDQSV